jgi:hypothetical protein
MPESRIYRRKINSPLLQHRSNLTSQSGEDGIIAHIFSVIEPSSRYCVEFGAWDGKHFSNCHQLLTVQEWGGLLIEADAEKYRELEQNCAGYERVTTLNRTVDFEGVDALDNILEEEGAPRRPGLISIDIDGNDYHVFESLKTYLPDVVLIEFNPTIPNDVFFVQDRSADVHHGCSLLALVMLAREKGYELAVATDWNAFFVANDRFAALGIGDNTIDTLYAPVQDGRIFQGYDGSIHVVGMDKLVWHGGIPLTSADFQVLPESVRRLAGKK